ncbi:FAD-binding domain-containing protein [Lentithecium fluviatile CBS 122367]|uniref:FAD-binding domain-containing protein n=1 Tax=Lentithecium fluviatile CBS 122367 TaxID=1168545 RepID=A0A6G1JAA0_9PLEO|nr:FAD-binding domain-containing protein [Lentithecium fluviatile CBS 122367]
MVAFAFALSAFVVPNDPCWPSPSTFSTLNTTLSGHLIQTQPPASVCYPTQPNYDPTLCTSILRSWFQSNFHASDPASIGWLWWAHNPCPPIYPNGTSVTGNPDAGSKGCSVGAYPAYAVNATEVGHVVAAVGWARETGVRLVVKSTGHSFQRRSTGLGANVCRIWTHNMRGIEYHEHFQHYGCPSREKQMAFTVAAGERVRHVYTAANERNLVVVAGSSQDVGIVGWFSGGGHGPLSSTYGFGVDNVLQITIVTPDGTLRTASPCLNPDLFWALRGGGGGTFGVITSVTMKAYPSPQVARHTFSMALTDRKTSPDGLDVGVGTIEALFAPIAQKLDPENGTTIVYNSHVEHYPSFFATWNATVRFEPVASVGAALGSRLLPSESLTANTTQLARVLQDITTPAEEHTIPPMLQAFPVANNNAAMTEETSITPAWRDAVLHFIVIDYFPDSDTYAEAKPALDRMTYERIAALKALAPDTGAYLNEADPFDPDWQQIKATYDLESLLWCISCVGSENWAEDSSGRLCKVS